MQASVALQLEDAKGQTHPNSERGPTYEEGQWSDYHTDVTSQVLLPPRWCISYGGGERTKIQGTDTISSASRSSPQHSVANAEHPPSSKNFKAQEKIAIPFVESSVTT